MKVSVSDILRVEYFGEPLMAAVGQQLAEQESRQQRPRRRHTARAAAALAGSTHHTRTYHPPTHTTLTHIHAHTHLYNIYYITSPRNTLNNSNPSGVTDYKCFRFTSFELTICWDSCFLNRSKNKQINELLSTKICTNFISGWIKNVSMQQQIVF